jgi:tetratricopeptide (TPR) repeat protein
MKTAVLPFNAVQESSAPLARQLAGYISEIVRGAGAEDVQALSLMGQQEQEGQVRYIQVNRSTELNTAEEVAPLYQDTTLDLVIDGLISYEEDGKGFLTLRWFDRGAEEPKQQETFEWESGKMIDSLYAAIKAVAKTFSVELPQEQGTVVGLFGTENSEAYYKFLTGFDTVQYIERSQGMVSLDYDVNAGMTLLNEASEADLGWEAPMLALLQLTRLAGSTGLATADDVHRVMMRMKENLPADPRVEFALGEFFMAAGDFSSAADSFEEAGKMNPDEAIIFSRLGTAQMNAGMPVNAERSLRKAVDLEPEGEKTSLDLLAGVLNATGRTHEIRGLWKEQIDKNPQYAEAYNFYARSFFQSGDDQKGIEVLNEALKIVDDTATIKRFYAPILRDKEEYDQAMDFFEDAIDEFPGDVQLKMDYVETLSAAGRNFEAPDVLKEILNLTTDQNVRAHAQAWLIEIEQPQRIEVIAKAQELAQKEDWEGALKELTPLKAWLADYWKLWAALAGMHNRAGHYEEAEVASKKLLDLYPGCEPGLGELCTAFAGQGKNEEAYNFMRQVLGAMPTSLSAAINFAVAAKHAGHNMDKSIEAALAQIE